MRKVYRVLDLFAGIGGLSYGFEIFKEEGRSVFETICAVDVDRYACETLRKNLEYRGENPDIVLQADLTDPETHDLIIKKCDGRVDIIIGGPPCQSYSSIGTRSAPQKIRNKFINDPRDRLYLEYIRLIKELRPYFIVFENVMGVLTKRDPDGKKYIDLIVESIQSCGYSTAFNDEYRSNYKILNAADYGVPQERQRVFIIANRLNILNRVPAGTHSKDGNLPGTLPYVTLRHAIGDLPFIQAPCTMWGIPKEKHEEFKLKNLNKKLGKDEDKYHIGMEEFKKYCDLLDEQGKKFLDFIKPEKEIKLTGHIARGQQYSDIELFKKMQEGTTSKDIFKNDKYKKLRAFIKYDMKSFKDKYRKHSWNFPCKTVFAHMEKDGNRFIHPDSKQARTFTVREAARIQSFPDDFIFAAPGTVRYKYIGNAVPPLVGKAIAEAIYKTLSSLNKNENIGTG
ncbi:MAG: DNA cytosine methyltransferase [Candidatus Eremiobacterota bacterium]